MADRIWTIRDLIAWVTAYLKEKDIEEPRLEAEVLLAFCLGVPRIRLYTDCDRPLEVTERERLKTLLRRRVKGEPLAYITGEKEFMSLPFAVSPSVLIPRPETETLVERAIEIIRERGFERVVDVGTGSGAIAASLAYYVPGLKVLAIDISSEALKLAAQNISRLGLTDRVILRQNDLLEGINESFDMVAANLPYVSSSALNGLKAAVRYYEPHLALWGGEDGFDLYRRLIPKAWEILSTGGCLLFEIDPSQEEIAVKHLAPFSKVHMIKDLAGRVRVAEAWKEPES